jgi:adhesin HecA-like repeat protein
MNLRLFFLLLSLAAHATAAETITLTGELTNTTGGVSAAATLVLTVDGETVTAQLKTSAPLSGTGKMAGQMRGGWCELHGRLEDGLTLKLRGVLNDRDFRGTYIAAVPSSLLQYGKFQLAREPATTAK